MSRRIRKRPPVRIAPPGDSVIDYFFRDGDPTQPRRDPVRRDELWGALDWYHRRVTAGNRWYRRLWRAVKQSPVVRFDPFAFVRGMQGRKEAGDGGD